MMINLENDTTKSVMTLQIFKEGRYITKSILSPSS